MCDDSHILTSSLYFPPDVSPPSDPARTHMSDLELARSLGSAAMTLDGSDGETSRIEPGSHRPLVVPRTPAGLLPQGEFTNDHVLVDRLAHVVDRQRSD